MLFLFLSSSREQCPVNVPLDDTASWYDDLSGTHAPIILDIFANEREDRESRAPASTSARDKNGGAEKRAETSRWQTKRRDLPPPPLLSASCFSIVRRE